MSKHLSGKPRRSLKAARAMDGLARAKLMDRIRAWRELSNFVGVLPGLSAATDLESLRKEWDS
jgi:hypothetical protein